jgi:GR25 family glycosyltransferase involved in LPS biosynthesis
MSNKRRRTTNSVEKEPLGELDAHYAKHLHPRLAVEYRNYIPIPLRKLINKKNELNETYNLYMNSMNNIDSIEDVLKSNEMLERINEDKKKIYHHMKKYNKNNFSKKKSRKKTNKKKTKKKSKKHYVKTY